MKKVLYRCFSILVMLSFLISLTACFGGSKTEKKEEININDINWSTYCLVQPYFLGANSIEGGKYDKYLEATCYLKVDTNYEISSPIYVRVAVCYDAFYYKNLTGGEEGHFPVTYYYEGSGSGHTIALTAVGGYSPWDSDKDVYSKSYTIEMKSISGKIYKK